MRPRVGPGDRLGMDQLGELVGLFGLVTVGLLFHVLLVELGKSPCFFEKSMKGGVMAAAFTFEVVKGPRSL